MVENPLWEICERVAEVQALLDDHLAGGKHTAAEVVAKAQCYRNRSCCGGCSTSDTSRRTRRRGLNSKFDLPENARNHLRQPARPMVPFPLGFITRDSHLWRNLHQTKVLLSNRFAQATSAHPTGF